MALALALARKLSHGPMWPMSLVLLLLFQYESTIITISPEYRSLRTHGTIGPLPRGHPEERKGR